MEEFRPIPFTNINVNSSGIVRYRDFRGNSREDSGFRGKNGYYMIKCFRKFYYVHRLVAIAWVENPAPSHFLVVHHLDNNQVNNNYTNLEWTTESMNLAQRVNMRLAKRTRSGMWKSSFIFDKRVYTGEQLYSEKKDAIAFSQKKKTDLINAKRNYIIKCENLGEKPYGTRMCVRCRSDFIDT